MQRADDMNILVQEILLHIGRNVSQVPNIKLTGFLSMMGSLYDRELMIVGRAVNGWLQESDRFLPSDIVDENTANKIAAKILQSVTGSDDSSMAWVTDYWTDPDNRDYNPRRSAFWRVVRKLVAEFGIADVENDPWSSHLVWSNLYKVAPAEGGNPSISLCDTQRAGCIHLLQLELSNYRPRRLLFLTGWKDWAEPFLKHVSPDVAPVLDFGNVKAFGKLRHDGCDEVKIVVADHPQGKNFNTWVQEVVNAFNQD